MDVQIKLDDVVRQKEVLDLYQANHWSSAEKPARLLAALRHSHALVTARAETRLIGLGNAISDGYLVVYYPHMLVHPDYHRQGIGKKMMRALQAKYADFHQQMLTADGDAVDFYRALGFARAGNTQPMWIYAGSEHG